MTERPASGNTGFYKAYRKIRYLAKRGSLFRNPRRQNAFSHLPGHSHFRIATVNSVSLFLASYVVIDTLNLFVTGFAATLFNIPVVVRYYDVDFLIRGIDWTSDSVSGVFSSGPVSMLVLAIFLLILFKAVETERGRLRLFVFWMILHALTRFFGEILAGAILSKGFGFVVLYLFVMDTGKVVLTIAGFSAMFVAGLFLARSAFYTANIDLNDLKSAYRRRFLTSQFLVPYLAGNAILVLLKSPELNYFDLTVNLTMLIFLTAFFTRSVGMEDLYFDQEPRQVSFKRRAMLAALFLLAAYRIILGIGIRM